ncbi:7 transmembrane receptor, partial (plasmid) [Idiomarina loihiensis]|uniref:7 transmembrane receptor n=1 Tax=Idiomarina loihiensis TaxID=135577 RepID=UPI0039BE6BF4
MQSWGPQALALFNNETVVDKVLPEMLHRIDPHWYQFPPMNPLWHGILAFITSIILIIASAGNGMVIYIFTTTKTLKTPSNLFIVNLALSDFLIITTMSPPVVVNTYYETWVFGP